MIRVNVKGRNFLCDHKWRKCYLTLPESFQLEKCIPSSFQSCGNRICGSYKWGSSWHTLKKKKLSSDQGVDNKSQTFQRVTLLISIWSNRLITSIQSREINSNIYHFKSVFLKLFSGFESKSKHYIKISETV